MKSLRISLYLLASGVSLLVLTACNISLAADVTPPPNYRPPVEVTEPAPVSGPVYPVLPPSAADGEAIFADKCSPCHGDAGLGDGPQAAQLPTDVTPLGNPNVARLANPSDWYQVVTQGKIDSFMPPFRSLTDRERWDVVAYSFGLSMTDNRIEAGRELYEQNCAACHGDQGMGNGPEATDGIPDFTHPKFMAANTTQDFFQAITEGVPPEMPGFGESLSEDQRWALSDYVRHLTFTAPLGSEQMAEQPATEEQSTAGEEAASGSGPDVSVAPAGDPESADVEVEAAGDVYGMVVNASGGEVPPGLEITLHSFDGMQSVETETTTVQEDGTYVFEDVEMPVGRMFLSTIEFEGATYGSELKAVQAAQGAQQLELPITVYETTTDPANVTVDRLHVFLEFVDRDTLRVIQLYILSNNGMKTLIAPEGEPTIRFNLPDGAQNLEIQNGALGERYISTPGGFGDTIALRPGQGAYQAMFAFEMPYQRGLDLVQPMSLPTNAVVVLVPDGSINVKGENLQDTGRREVDGMTYRMFSRGGLSAGDPLRLTISGRYSDPSASLFNIGSSSDLLVGAGVFGLALIAAGIILYRRSSESVEEDDEAVETPDEDIPPDDAPENLMDAILALDDLYREGKLPEEAYIQRRRALKERLRRVVDTGMGE